MVPVEPSSDAASVESMALPEIIFSCGVCQLSVSEVYATPESNRGFHSGSGDDDGIVTRLWIAECSHVTCGKHLTGGAAPFHPHGEQPQALCPQCARLGDDTPKKLYGIRGLGEGEHDSAISRTWFQCPPIRLDGAMPGMDAVRFQYMALARYSQKAHARWKAAEEKHASAAHGLARERKRRKQSQADLEDAKTRAASDVAALEKAQASLKKWEERMPVINSLIAAVTPMADDLRQMRHKLTGLGYDVPRRSYGFADTQEGTTKVKDAQVNSQTRANRETQYPSSPRKRKREEHELGLDDRREPILHHSQRLSSRDAMPPPPAQKLPRRELQQNTSVLPRTRVPQQREVYERPLLTPTLRHTDQDLSMRHTRPNQVSQGRSQDWEAHPGLDPGASDQPHYVYEHSANRRDTDERPRLFANAEQHRNVDRTFAYNIWSPFKSQSFAAHPAPSRRVFQENIRSNLQERPHPSSLSESDQQYQQRQIRQPLRPVQIDQSELQPSKRSPYLNAGPELSMSPLKAGLPTVSSISSPLFQRDMSAPRVASRRRSPTRAGDVEFMRERLSQRGPPSETTGHSMRKEESVTRRNSFAPTHNRRQFPNGLQSSSGSFEQAPSSATLSYRGPTAISQAPRDLRCPHDTRDYAPSPQHQSNNRQPIPGSRGRITLPPSSSAIQEYGLASIRGVRGGLPHRAEGFSGFRDSDYSGSRPLFLPVSRRSVRR